MRLSAATGPTTSSERSGGSRGATSWAERCRLGCVEEEPEPEAHQADDEHPRPGDAGEGQALPEGVVAVAVVPARGAGRRVAGPGAARRPVGPVVVADADQS